MLLCRRTEKEEAIVTVGIGVVSFPDGAAGATVEDYIHCANSALYRSKSAGKNRVTPCADMAGATD